MRAALGWAAVLAASMVIEALVNHGAVVTQVDTGDFPQRWTVTGRIDSAGVWRGALVGPDVQVDLESVTALYYRRPSRYRVAAGVSPADRRFAEAEAHHGVGGLLSCLPCRWVSHPARIADAPAKPGQLRLAAACVLRVPETLSALGVTANQFQRYIADKDTDLRITAVGERLFPVAIRARTPAARADWLRDYDSLDYEVVEVPDDVAAGLQAYLKATGLAFAAFDLVRTTVGEHYFWRPTRMANGGGSPMSLTFPWARSIPAAPSAG